jgi:hypothetical protein
LPDAHQCALACILGEIDVAQDPARHGEEPRCEPGGQQREGRSVASLCSLHEREVHVPPLLIRRRLPAHSNGMGGTVCWNLQSRQGAHEDAGGALPSPAF